MLNALIEHLFKDDIIRPQLRKANKERDFFFRDFTKIKV